MAVVENRLIIYTSSTLHKTGQSKEESGLAVSLLYETHMPHYILVGQWECQGLVGQLRRNVRTTQ